MIVGNKSDSEKTGKFAANEDEIDQLRKLDKSIMHFETSARTGYNINEAIENMCLTLIDNDKINNPPRGTRVSSNRGSQRYNYSLVDQMLPK